MAERFRLVSGSQHAVQSLVAASLWSDHLDRVDTLSGIPQIVKNVVASSIGRRLLTPTISHTITDVVSLAGMLLGISCGIVWKTNSPQLRRILYGLFYLNRLVIDAADHACGHGRR